MARKNETSHIWVVEIADYNTAVFGPTPYAGVTRTVARRKLKELLEPAEAPRLRVVKYERAEAR